jgi:hypothetical protein
MTYEVHPLAEIVPEMGQRDYHSLKDSIAKNGLYHEITLYEGKILDGRHRYKACVELKVEPSFTQYVGKEPADFVLAENLSRRHLTQSQLSMVSSKYAKVVAEEAAKRSQANLKVGDARHCRTAKSGDDLGATGEILGKKFGVSARSVNRAISVREKGIDKLVTAVESGEVTVNEAERIAKLKPESQERIMGLGSKKARAKELAYTERLSKTKKRQQRDTSKPIAAPAEIGLHALIMGRVELITNDLIGRGLVDPDAAVKALFAEINLADPYQRERVEHCLKGLDALAKIREELKRRLSETSNVVSIRQIA